jgi:hypothetical protein
MRKLVFGTGAAQMKSSANISGFSVYRMGELAEDSLKPGSHGEVLAATTNALYLRSSAGELLWLVGDSVPMHRRAVQIRGSLPEVTRGSAFSVRGQSLVFDLELELDMSPASIWLSPRPRRNACLPFERLPDRLRATSRVFAGYPPAVGFGPFLLELTNSGGGNPSSADSPASDSILDHARPVLNEVFRAVRDDDSGRILRVTEELIGLGKGLTPSGDDFAGGLLFSSSVLSECFAQYQAFVRLDVAGFLDRSRKRTNFISHVILKDLALGHAFDTLQRFMMEILTDQPLEKVRTLGLEVVRTGHSTGWDLMTGLWMGLLLGSLSRGASSSLPRAGALYGRAEGMRDAEK